MNAGVMRADHSFRPRYFSQDATAQYMSGGFSK